MHLEIITPDTKVFEGDVISSTFPGTKGEFQVLNNHAPLVSSLSQGKIKVKTEGDTHSFRILGGVVEVLDNKISVLAEGIY